MNVALLTLALLTSSSPSLSIAGDFFLSKEHSLHAMPTRTPWVVNLEGALCQRAIGAVRQNDRYRLCIDLERTLETFKRLNVKAVSLSNNHSLDAGTFQKALLIKRLQNAGITVIDAVRAFCRDGVCVLASFDDDNLEHLRNEIDFLKTKNKFVVHFWHRQKRTKAPQTNADLVVQTGSHVPFIDEQNALHLGDFVFDCECSKAQTGLVLHIYKKHLRAEALRVAKGNNTIIRKTRTPKNVIDLRNAQWTFIDDGLEIARPLP